MSHPRSLLSLALLLIAPLALGCDEPPSGEDAGSRRDAGRADAGDGGGRDAGGGDGSVGDGGRDAGGSMEDAGPESSVARYVSLSAGDGFGCAARDDGRAVCWGRNDRGQLGLGVTDGTIHATAARVLGEGGAPLAGITEIAAGGAHTCARVLRGGTSRILCWGANDRMQLGAPGARGDQVTPVTVAFSAESALTGIASIAAGAAHGCARTELGQAYCWGDGTLGQIGRGEAMDTNEVTQVLGEDGAGLLEGVNAISAFGDTSCALIASAPNTPLCWGRATSCGTPAVAPRVLLSFGGPLADAAPGRGFTCGLRESGSVRCAGENASGQLGTGRTGSCSVASVEVVDATGGAPLAGAAALAVGQSHTCAATADGVVCWGLGAAGRLGDGDEADTSRPPVAVLGVGGAGAFPAPALLAAGRAHTCAVLRPGDAAMNDEIYCWGEGYGATPLLVDAE